MNKTRFRACHRPTGTREASVRTVIGLPVRVGDIRVGFVSDVILRPDFSSVLGCEVGKPGGTQAFLPTEPARRRD